MSLPLTPYERWESGTNQNSVPANNNSLRDEIFNTDGIADDVAAQPGSPDDGDWYIIPAAATGTQWATFAEDSVAIFYGGTWYEFVPAEGNKVSVSANLLIYDGSGGWQSLAPPGTGDFSGPASSADNALVRFDGTGGKTGQNSGVLVTDADEISGYKGNINRQTGTTYTLVAADSGKIVELANAASIALTADPALPKGFCCTIVQALAGVVTIASSGSGTVVNRQSQFKTAGTNAMCTVYVRSNSGSDAVFVFGGDTAA